MNFSQKSLGFQRNGTSFLGSEAPGQSNDVGMSGLRQEPVAGVDGTVGFFG